MSPAALAILPSTHQLVRQWEEAQSDAALAAAFRRVFRLPPLPARAAVVLFRADGETVGTLDLGRWLGTPYASAAGLVEEVQQALGCDAVSRRCSGASWLTERGLARCRQAISATAEALTEAA